MTAALTTMLAKLEEHRADPSNPEIIRDFHEIAAGARGVIQAVIESALPDRPLTDLLGAKVAAPASAQQGASSAPAVSADSSLVPELEPPATNWGTNQRLDCAQAVLQPRNSDQVRQILELAVKQKRKAKPIGTSHSSSAIFCTSGVLVDSGALSQPSIAAATSTLRQCRELEPGLYRLEAAQRALHIEIGSGAQVKDVSAYLAASQRALAMTGAYTGQTLVGAYCTSTHGAGRQHPPLHAGVRSIQLLTVDEKGQVIELRIEPTHGITDAVAYARRHPQVRLIQDDAWFSAVVVALGCMGFITSVIIQVVKAFSLLRQDWKGNWEQCRAMLRDVGEDGTPRCLAGTYSASISLTPYAVPLCLQGRQSVVMGRSWVQDTAPAAYTAPSQTGLSPLLIMAGRLTGNTLPALSPFLIDQALGGDSTKPTWGPSCQMLGNPDNLPPGYSAEYAFPLDRYLDAVDAILARMGKLAEHDVKYMIGPITLRWVGKDTAFLSMSEGADRVYVECLSLAGTGQGQQVLAAIEEIALAHDGRPHWGQWFSLEAMPRILKLYPRYQQWKEIYQQLNVSRLFGNEFTDKLP